ncbi:MAG: hypothetical protein AAF514_09345, partial [Verrucomicrobiota bacterium]
VDRAKAGAPGAYRMKAFTYIYQGNYGSPEVDPVEPTITKVTVADDGYSVRLVVDPLTKGHVHELKLEGVRSAEGDRPLLHPIGYYTLNEIPVPK